MRTKCDADGCRARKPNHKMYEVKRSRIDPTVLGHACSLACVGKVLAKDPGPLIVTPIPLRFSSVEPSTFRLKDRP